MRKSWIIRKDEKAVSPVIATILMVAITVVLAAVLYVMVTGLIGGGSSQPPTIQLGAQQPTGVAGTYTIRVDGVDRAVALTSFSVMLQNITTTPSNIWTTPKDVTNGVIGSGSGSGASGANGLTLSFTDTNGDTKFNQGDYFTLAGVGSAKNYKIILYWKASGNAITEREING